MATLKTTISLASTTLFPSAVNVTAISNEVLTSSIGNFQSAVIDPASVITLLDVDMSTGETGVLYFYCQSDAANPTSDIEFTIQNKSGATAKFAKLLPGGVMYLPLYTLDDLGTQIIAKNNDPGKPATIMYLLASKD